jgi:hypothetical protein
MTTMIIVMASLHHRQRAIATHTPVMRMPAARITPMPRHFGNSVGLADGGGD